MTKGLIKYIRAPLPAGAPDTDVDKRTQVFGIILSFLSFSERLAINVIFATGTQNTYVLWADIKDRHEKVDISRVWAYWRRLNTPPAATLSDRAAITTSSLTPSRHTTRIGRVADRSTSTPPT